LDPSLIFPSKFKNLRIETRAEMGYEELFFAKSLEIKTSLVALITGELALELDGKLRQGRIQGDFQLDSLFKPAEYRVSLLPKKLSLDLLSPFLNQYLPTNFEGKPAALVSGQIQWAGTFQNGIRDASVDVTLADFRLIGISAQIQGMNLVLPDLRLSPVMTPAHVALTWDDGRMVLSQLKFPGDDIELELTGRLQMAPRGGILRSNLRGKFAFSPVLFEKIPLLEVLKEHKGEDGFFPLTVIGSPQKNSIRIGQFDLSEMLSF
jgi:type II secretion system protein N